MNIFPTVLEFLVEEDLTALRVGRLRKVLDPSYSVVRVSQSLLRADMEHILRRRLIDINPKLACHAVDDELGRRLAGTEEEEVLVTRAIVVELGRLLVLWGLLVEDVERTEAIAGVDPGLGERRVGLCREYDQGFFGGAGVGGVDLRVEVSSWLFGRRIHEENELGRGGLTDGRSSLTGAGEERSGEGDG